MEAEPLKGVFVEMDRTHVISNGFETWNQGLQVVWIIRCEIEALINKTEKIWFQENFGTFSLFSGDSLGFVFWK